MLLGVGGVYWHIEHATPPKVLSTPKRPSISHLGKVNETQRAPKALTSLRADPAPFRVRSPRIPERLRRYSFGRARYGLVISLDGVSYDAIRRWGPKFPHFRRLIRKGFLRPAQTVFPSVTWSAHTSITTGQYPRHHGVLGNRWLEDFQALMYPFQADVTEPSRRIRTPNVFDLARAKRWKTAALNWPATQRARNITYNMPEVMYSISLTHRFLSRPLRRLIQTSFWKQHRDPSRWDRDFFRFFLGRLAASEKIETDMFVRDLAIKLVSSRKRPRLMFAHFVTPDSWFHKYGNTPWLERWAIEQMDGMIGKLIKAYKRAGIWRKTAMFVTSDHGFLTARKTFAIRELMVRKGISRFRSMRPRNRRRAKVMAFLNGHVAYVYVKPPYQKTYLPRLVSLFRSPKWKECIQSVHLPRVFRQMGLPKPDLYSSQERKRRIKQGRRLVTRHPGAPSLLVLARPECVFVRSRRRGKPIIRTIKKTWRQFGVHGYVPTHRKLWAFILGHGPGIRARQKWGKMSHLVDLAPTLMHLMGARWPRRWKGFGKGKPMTLDGRIMRDVLRR
jgi:predicted AlkP superfamily pyrophosphatase or phosphodiesterase